MFARLRPVVVSPASDPAPAVNEEHIALAILASFEGKEHPEHLTLSPLMEQTLAGVRQLLRIRDQRELEHAVEFSMHASEAMAASSQITSDVRETASLSGAIASRLEEVNIAIERLDEMAGTALVTMGEAKDATHACVTATQTSVDVCQHIGDSFRDMGGAVGELNAAAMEIGSFVATINAIAGQTNLLALNATIEAARAGEAGKGFAVVASEVKTLAMQTQKATDDIRSRIERLTAHVTQVVTGIATSEQRVSEAIEASRRVESGITTIDQMVSETATRMSDISVILHEKLEISGQLREDAVNIDKCAGKAASHVNHVLSSIGAAEKVITAQFAALDKREIPNYVLYRAKSDHLLWKKRLSELLAGLHTLHVEELLDHRQCRLGKWYGSVSDEQLRRQPAFVALNAPHEAVHTHGREAARLFHAGDKQGARAAYLRMDEASREVLKALQTLIEAPRR